MTVEQVAALADEIRQEKITKGEGAASVVTPSGLSIRFESKPRRHYVIEGGYFDETPGAMPEMEREWKFDPDYPPKEAVSVTTALDCFYKGGLDWWGMRVGISGVLALIRRGEFALTEVFDANGGSQGFVGAVVDEHGAWQYADMPKPGDEVVNVEARLKEHGLRVDKIKGAAADRGANVHDALEIWGNTGNLPDPKTFPPNEAPYVHGLVQFLIDSKIEPVATERLVGSYDHGFAGRFDLECRQPYSGQKVVTRCDLVKPKLVEIPTGIGRFDLKTASGVYFNNLLQVAGYELGCMESGYGESDWRGVLRVTADGKYELRLNPHDHRSITTDDFVRAIDAWNLVRKATEAIKV